MSGEDQQKARLKRQTQINTTRASSQKLSTEHADFVSKSEHKTMAVARKARRRFIICAIYLKGLSALMETMSISPQKRSARKREECNISSRSSWESGQMFTGAGE